jgi:hypothetical protein
MKKTNYKRKYIKYKTKYLNIKYDGDLIIIPSELYQFIYIKPTNKSPGFMKFGNSNNKMQSMYDINDLDIFYFKYFYAIITILQYCQMKKVLMIGLGGGHLPMLIKNKLPDSKIDVIEIDPNVLIASKIMGFNENNLNIWINDGQKFMEKTSNIYDCIVIDLDSEQSSITFDFNLTKKILNDKGLLAINYCHNSENLSEKLIKIFPVIKIYQAAQQYVYLCSNKDIFNDPITKYTASNNMRKMKYFDDIIFQINNMSSVILKNI